MRRPTVKRLPDPPEPIVCHGCGAELGMESYCSLCGLVTKKERA